MNDHDPLESAFELLKARSPERAHGNLELEEMLMKAHNENRSAKPSRFAKIAGGILLCIVVAGVAEAATGVVRKHLFRAVVVDAEGNKHDVQIEVFDVQEPSSYQIDENSDGSYDVTVDVTDQHQGPVTVTVD